MYKMNSSMPSAETMERITGLQSMVGGKRCNLFMRVMKSSPPFISTRMSTKEDRIQNGPWSPHSFKLTLFSLTEQIVIKLLFAIVLDSCTLSHRDQLPTNQGVSKKIIKFSSSYILSWFHSYSLCF